MSITQREGVFQAVCQVLGVDDADLKERGGKLGKVELTSDQKKQVHQILIPRFLKKEITYDEAEGPMTPEKAKKYVGGLTNNWLRKDTRMNGGEKYKPKNPGIRQGSGDEQMKAMKGLLVITQDPAQRAIIEAEIERRKEFIENSKRPVLDPTKLPESLRHLVPASMLATQNGATVGESSNLSEEPDESVDESKYPDDTDEPTEENTAPSTSGEQPTA